MYGMASVKWLERVTVLDAPFGGHQQREAYRFRIREEEEGEPLSTIAPRALMIPPGVPEFPSRVRFVRPGPVELRGRAWSGFGRIVRLDLSEDRGLSWAKATVGEPPGQHAWAPWTYRWEAHEGPFELWCRATDETGRTQPLEPRWNLGGYANNEIQRVTGLVRDDRGPLQ
jgi:DMSO/TMAO reductase YedYZ molybdopterin-dependent catalytic subunit